MAVKSSFADGGIADRTPRLSAIAQYNVSKVIELEPRFRELQGAVRPGPGLGKPPIQEYVKLEEEISTNALIGIVFAGMALESCLYSMVFQMKRDQVSAILNDARLPSRKRWQVLLWRLTDEFLDEKDPFYKSLDRLIAARNRIVHSKAFLITPTTREQVRSWDVLEEAKHSIETMRQFEGYVRRFDINLAYTLLGVAGYPDY
jgi:hypothetical protein